LTPPLPGATQSLVIDASIAASWLLPDEHTDASRRAYALLRTGALDAHAPDLWLMECTNIICNAVKRRRLAKADAMYTWSVLEAVRAHVTLNTLETEHVQQCLALALDHGLSLYDSAYLWLASSTRRPLMTQDRALTAAAHAIGTPVYSLNTFA
jgi:predicted nucleic acid-binding protein